VARKMDLLQGKIKLGTAIICGPRPGMLEPGCRGTESLAANRDDLMRSIGHGWFVRGVAAVIALAGFAGAAQARPNPCLDLASIVANYDNISSYGGKTAAELFAGNGKLTVFAKLGQAAAHV